MAAELFGPYRLDELIGRGGMGEVYRAFDTVKQRTVALKRLPVALAADAEFQARFRKESALAARLSEPHIIPIHDYGEIDGQLFIDMRLVAGRDLASLLAVQGPMRPVLAVDIVGQVARALDAAHADGLVHRDVKPSNVLITGADGDEFAYLIDFGISRALAAGGGTSITVAGATVGTLDYMAPERFRAGPIDARADVYSLACLLFEALTGSRPFPGEGLPAMIHAHLNVDPPRPSTERPGVPVALDGVIARGMAKEPERRYPSAGALAAAARAALVAPVVQRVPSPVSSSPVQRVPPPVPSPPVVGSNPAAGRTPPPARPPPMPPPTPQRVWTPAEQADVPVSPRAPGRSGRTSLIIIGLLVAVVAVVAMVAVVVGSGVPLPVTRDSTSAFPRDITSMVTATIRVGVRPDAVAVSPDGRRAYVTNDRSDTVSVIDTEGGAVTATIPVGAGPWGVAVSPDGRRAYVTNDASNTVSVIDTGGGAVTATIRVGVRPDGVAVSPDGRRSYLTNAVSNTVSVIDTGGGAVTATIPVGAIPQGVAVSPDGRRAYVTNGGAGTVSVIDTGGGAVTATIPVGDRPDGVAVSLDGRRAYITNYGSNTVSVIDTVGGTVTATIPVGARPVGVAVSPDGRRAYVTNAAAGTVSVIDTGGGVVTATIPVGAIPQGVAVSPDGRRAYVTNAGSGTMSVIDLG